MLPNPVPIPLFMPELHPIRPALFLDYGIDAVDAEGAACEICERGMRFNSPWQFALGTFLHLAFAFEDGSSRRIEAEAYVVDCLAGEEREYQTTLAFVEPPEELRASLGKVATRLEFPSRRGGSPLVSKLRR